MSCARKAGGNVRPKFVDSALDMLSSPVSLINPLIRAKVVVSDECIEVQPNMRRYSYRIYDPRGMSVHKMLDGAKQLDISRREELAVQSMVKPAVDAELKKHMRGSSKPWLGGVLLSQWESAMNREVRSRFSDLIDVAGGVRRGELRKKYEGISLADFLSEKPLRDVLRFEGTEYEKNQEHAYALSGAEFLLDVKKATLKTLGFRKSIFSDAFFLEALDLILKKNNR
jgi:hypothetical protein